MRTVCKCLRAERPSIHTSSRASTVNSGSPETARLPHSCEHNDPRRIAGINQLHVLTQNSGNGATTMQRSDEQLRAVIRSGLTDRAVERQLGILRSHTDVMSHRNGVHFWLPGANLLDARFNELYFDFRPFYWRFSFEVRRSLNAWLAQERSRTAQMSGFIGCKKTPHD